MGKDTNQTDELRDQPRPELPDDQETAQFDTESRGDAPVRDDGEDKDRPQPKLRGIHPTMDEIVKAAREKRDSEEHSQDYKPHEADAEPPPDQEEPAPVVAKGPSQGPSSHQEPAAQSDELEIVVDGARMKIRRSDYPEISSAPDDVIIRIAQRDKASERRLAQTNALLKSAKAATTQDPSAYQPGDTDGAAPAQVTRPDPAPSYEPTSLDEEKLAEIASKLQVGDANEGADAVKELYELATRAATNANDPSRISAAVAMDLQQRESQAEITRAIDKFGSENPDLVANPYLEEVALKVAGEVLKDDLRTLGITDEQIDALGPDKRVLALTHRSLRVQGHQMPAYENVLDRVASKMRESLNLPKPAGGSQPQPGAQSDAVRERQQRKEHAQPQPRHGGVRAGTAPQEPKTKTAFEHIQDMRAKRGFRRNAS